MRKHFPFLILLGCAAVFSFGIVQLFELRFAAGDVYPAYSSLRADPLGAMAFYESLGKISGLSVRRDFSAADRLPEEPHTVYLHFAATRYDWNWVSKDLFQEVDDFLARGGRLVITFYPQTESELFNFEDEDETNSVKSAKSDEKKMTPARPHSRHKKKSDEDEYDINLNKQWGFYLDFQKLNAGGDVYKPARVLGRTDLPLPRALDWHSGIIFTNLDKSWRVIYARGPSPVLIERTFRNGSVVMATDSYFVSNEAMAADRHADLLAWLIGANRNVVFDEAHLGIVETSGVAVLMRKYHLQGLAAGLILLAGLFIWKNATSLVPPHTGGPRENLIVGRDATAGFVNLLRRSIAPRDLLATCFAEWKKSVPAKGNISTKRFQQVETIFSDENSSPNRTRNPLATYRKISETLGTRNPKL
jgi:hypothetical protein